MASLPQEQSTQQIVEGVPVHTARSPDGRSHLSVAPQLGGLVMQLVLAGHQWLARNPYVGLEHRFEGKAIERGMARPYMERGDVGLGDLCLFTVGPDQLTLPSGSTVGLTDHGEAWALRPPQVTIATAAGGITTHWRQEKGPLLFQLERELRFDAGGVRCRFELTNSGETPLPLFWSSHDTMPLDAGTRFQLPAGTEMVVFHTRRVEFAPGVHLWPRFTLRDGRPLDLSHPLEARARLGRDFACKLFTRSPVGPLGIQQGERTLTLEGEGTRVGLWINWGGEGPPGERYQIACPERCMGGATDKVSEGFRSGDAEWLEPGGTYSWSLFYSATGP